MSPSAIASFRTKSLTVQYAAHGVTVTFRGADASVILSPVRVSLDLETGGLKQGGEYNCRLLQSSLATAPARGEQITFNGRKYTISETKDTISTPLEYVCVIKPGSRV